VEEGGGEWPSLAKAAREAEEVFCSLHDSAKYCLIHICDLHPQGTVHMQLADERRRQGEMTERVLAAESRAKQRHQELQRSEAVRAQMQKEVEEANVERYTDDLRMFLFKHPLTIVSFCRTKVRPR